VGPIQRFAALLQGSAYAPLLRHADATTLQQAQPDDNTYVEVVGITPPGGAGAARPSRPSRCCGRMQMRMVMPAAALAAPGPPPAAPAAPAAAAACAPPSALTLRPRPVPPRAELRQLYVWVVRRQPEDSVFAGCWMTDSVTVFNGTVKQRQGFGPGASK
jgi:hypothetical protein